MRFPRSKRSIGAGIAVLALAGGGGGAALAATQSGKDSRDAYLDSVAKHLGVTREKLDDATKAAAIEQVDAAVAAGRLTKAQADKVKERIEAGDAPFFGAGGPVIRHRFGGGPGSLGGPGPGDKLSAAAKYLELTADQLETKLRAGQTLADVAKAQKKTVEGLEQAIIADAKAKLDQAVTDKRLTEAERTEALNRLQDHVDDLVNGRLPDKPRGFGRRGHGPDFF